MLRLMLSYETVPTFQIVFNFKCDNKSHATYWSSNLWISSLKIEQTKWQWINEYPVNKNEICIKSVIHITVAMTFRKQFRQEFGALVDHEIQSSAYWSIPNLASLEYPQAIHTLDKNCKIFKLLDICSITALQCHIMVNSSKLVLKRQEMTNIWKIIVQFRSQNATPLSS